MKLNVSRYAIFVLATAAGYSQPALPEGLRTALYGMQPSEAGFSARNPAQNLTVDFSRAGESVFRYRSHRFSLALSGEAPVTGTRTRDNRLEFDRGGVTEWFLNQPEGVEQGFTVTASRGAGPLRLTLAVGGDLRPVLEGADVALFAGKEKVLRYAGLRSWDAVGHELPARAEVEGGHIALVVDDRGARYPVTVDPAVQEAELTASDPFNNNLFGASVALSGDTAVIGSPSSLFQNKQTAYIFVRTGNSWVQQAELTSPDPVLFFGSSVAISGDTVMVDSDSGAYVFTRSGTTWTEQALLSPGTQQPAIAIDGDTAIVASVVYTRSNGTWTQQAVLSGGGPVAISGDTALFGSAVYTRSNGIWSQQATLTPSVSDPAFGSRVSLSGDIAAVAAFNSASGPGVVYIFTRTGTVWSQQARISPGSPNFGETVSLNGGTLAVGDDTAGLVYVYTQAVNLWPLQFTMTGSDSVFGDSFAHSVSVSGDTVLSGAPQHNNSTGAAYVFRLSNVTLLSNPSGRSFTLNSAGCGTAGTFTTPYSGFWTTCTMQWTSPDTSVTGTRYTFQSWYDGLTVNPRTFTAPSFPITYSANFLTEYLLTTEWVPVSGSGGTVTGGGWYTAGSSATVAAVPSPGFLFTGFSGALSGFAWPQSLLMSGPQSVTGNFSQTPPAVLTAVVSAKGGAASNRQWTITLTNTGPGTAYNAELFALAFTQTFGTPCTSLPVRLTPSALPVSLGTLAINASAQTAVSLDFSACPANARFTVGLGYATNSGASGGMISLVNQFQ